MTHIASLGRDGSPFDVRHQSPQAYSARSACLAVCSACDCQTAIHCQSAIDAPHSAFRRPVGWVGSSVVLSCAMSNDSGLHLFHGCVRAFLIECIMANGEEIKGKELEEMDWFYTLLFWRRSGGLGEMACSVLGKSALSKYIQVLTMYAKRWMLRDLRLLR